MKNQLKSQFSTSSEKWRLRAQHQHRVSPRTMTPTTTTRPAATTPWSWRPPPSRGGSAGSSPGPGTPGTVPAQPPASSPEQVSWHPHSSRSRYQVSRNKLNRTMEWNILEFLLTLLMQCSRPVPLQISRHQDLSSDSDPGRWGGRSSVFSTRSLLTEIPAPWQH